ncbi:hypothetical protein ADK93_26155 [Streptomyces sp. XY58]|nr:hypothetical protein ADK96_08375 [Streptomyces sp. IGB124]KOU83941.1 hypothetical protein ADK93_26155 [Streptomyces sp. XY58]KOV07299.1 hypothetical protein ADK89_11390 [Streptomyces sp. XY37]KOV14759.1 hypothetical protein ADK90_33220 [Streptomyces sp. XY413]KOV49650.1 hypothetical protein ADK99_11965 [Streptomyces sp. MMG1064]
MRDAGPRLPGRVPPPHRHGLHGPPPLVTPPAAPAEPSPSGRAQPRRRLRPGPRASNAGEAGSAPARPELLVRAEPGKRRKGGAGTEPPSPEGPARADVTPGGRGPPPRPRRRRPW